MGTTENVEVIGEGLLVIAGIVSSMAPSEQHSDGLEEIMAKSDWSYLKV